MFVKEFKHVLQGLMLRQTSKTKFLGKRIFPERKITKETLKSSIDPKEATAMNNLREHAEWIFMEKQSNRDEEWKNSGSRGDKPVPENLDEWFQLARIFRMTATLPALARRALDEDRLLSTSELERYNWEAETAPSSHHGKLKELADSSNKFKDVLTILGKVKAAKKRRRSSLCPSSPL